MLGAQNASIPWIVGLDRACRLAAPERFCSVQILNIYASFLIDNAITIFPGGASRELRRRRALRNLQRAAYNKECFKKIAIPDRDMSRE